MNLLATANASGLPLGDWQFWVVSGVALGGVVLAIRPLLASSRGSAPPCGGCGGSGGGAKSGANARTTLTIGGELPDAKASTVRDLR